MRLLPILAALALASPAAAQDSFCAERPVATGGGYYLVLHADSLWSRHTRLDQATYEQRRAASLHPGDTVRVLHDYDLRLVCSSVVAAPPDTSSAPPPPPPSPGEFFRNRPAGLTTLYAQDYDFAYTSPGRGERDLPAGGGRHTDWGLGVFLGTRAESIAADGMVWVTTYPPGLSGTGPEKVSFALPRPDVLYLSWRVLWEDGFDHNGTSEKWLHFNVECAEPTFIFQLMYGVEAVEGIPEPGPGSYPEVKDRLRANRAPVAKNASGDPLAVPPDGELLEYELLLDRTTRTVKWWRNGVLHAEHVGVTIPAICQVEQGATWGGGGNKQGTHERLVDHLVIAGG